MKLKELKTLGVSGKTAIVRVDFNVPLKDGVVSDNSRIVAAMPTIDYLAAKGAKIVLISHFGRPDGREEKYSLGPVAHELARVLGRKLLVLEEGAPHLPDYDIPHVYFLKHDLEKTDLRDLVVQMRPKDIAFLENVRFYKGEKRGDPKFARRLAALGDVFVNEAFSNSHRDDASMTGIPQILPVAAGLGIAAEVQALGKLLLHPKKPFVIMMGGVKLADKAPALLNLAPMTDHILLGGGLANLFLRVCGFSIGKSVADEKNEEPVAKALWRDHKEKIILPHDVVVSSSREGEPEVVKADKVKAHHMILDIGPQTILEYSKALKSASTLLWAGALGYFENPAFSHGTFSLARLFASRTSGQAYGVAGGGETLQVVSQLGVGEYIDHLSTGGGAMLNFLAGEKLPGLEALRE